MKLTSYIKILLNLVVGFILSFTFITIRQQFALSEPQLNCCNFFGGCFVIFMLANIIRIIVIELNRIM